MLRHRPLDFELNRYSPQANGLVFWAPLLGNNAVDFISGKVGTRSAALTRVPSARGQVFDFTASPLIYWTPTYRAFPATVMAWVYPDAASNLMVPVTLGTTTASNGWTLALHGDIAGDPVRFYNDGAGNYSWATAGSGFVAGSWQHIAGVWAANNSRSVFVNGGNKGTNTTSIATDQATINRLAIGATYFTAPSYHMDGKIMDVRIYRRALSDAEIAAYYRNPWDLFAPTQQWWIVPDLIATDALSAADIDTGAVTAGSPPIGQAHGLASNGVTAGAATAGAPALAHIYNLSATSIVSGAATAGAPALSQAHSLAAVSATGGAPTLGSPVIGAAHVLTANGIATGTATAGTPTLGQAHGVDADDIATPAPSVGTGSLGQAHSFSATGIVTGAPTLGNPLLSTEGSDNLAADGIATGAATLGNPAMGQQHGLTADGIVTTPALGTPTLGHVHNLSANGIAQGAAVLGTPTLGNVGADALTAMDIATGAPTLGAPTFWQRHGLIAAGIATRAPTLGTPLLGGRVLPAENTYIIPFEDRVCVIPYESRTYEV